MYDHIRGEVVELHAARVVLAAGGVGYELEVPTSTSAQLEGGTTARLFTILHVVDGVPTLLGFAQKSDRELARALLSVSGVGKAMSLAILSTYTPGELGTAVLHNDVAALKCIKGVGAKTAERLCLELRDKVAKLDLREFAAAAEPTVELMPQSAADAIAALVTLGFSDKEARNKVGKAREKQADLATEDLIKAVLRG